MKEKKITLLRSKPSTSIGLLSLALLSLLSFTSLVSGQGRSEANPFRVVEATIVDIHSAYKAGELTSRQLV